MRSANGGPAFPVPGLQHDEDFNGMSLRDYFAAQALQGIVASLMAKETWHGWSNPDIAKEAFDIADNMLAERAK